VVKVLSPIAGVIFGDYKLCRVFSLGLDHYAEPPPSPWVMGPLQSAAPLLEADDPLLRSLARCAGQDAYGFGAWVGDQLAAVCWFWVAERYKQVNFWPLGPQEAKLVEVATARRFRGRGIAVDLIRFASFRMKELGYRRLYAKVWHSNSASVSAFRKAGWEYIAFVIQLHPFGAKHPWRLVRQVSPS
jgi:ribosomal protein S18 acetylase RimI-like enzyme